ncbi:unnamed protein product, partial [Tetraodon nigroviridis]
VPVSMKEVGGHIEKQVAYLSGEALVKYFSVNHPFASFFGHPGFSFPCPGGRGEDSSVIITLPECSAFSDIPEEALAKVFTYLTLIPRTRQPGVKFIIILDRRLDTWASIKTALSRIAASFPGNLHLVLVLRPTSFFHRTVTDIGFRFSQEDFMLKMPVRKLPLKRHTCPPSQQGTRPHSISELTEEHRPDIAANIIIKVTSYCMSEVMIGFYPGNHHHHHYKIKIRRQILTLDAFCLPLQVVMLSSVTDLLRYIDENQLTSEFGGTLDYCHSDWMFLRTAIESFAVTVKDIAQMLQSFGTELAETELPDDGRDTEHLLETHTAKYRKLKDAIISVSKDGHHLLLSLETSGKEEDAQWDVRMDWETVQRLYTQLRDMELAFDGFFEKHRLKFHQYLQLLRYEQRFQEMETRLQDLISEERELLVSASSLAQTEQVLKRFDSLESNAQEVMSQTQIIVLHGHQLSAGHHYAVALIMQRCNELRHYCDTLDAALKAKRAHLLQTHQLLLCLGQAQTWCDDGAYLLANQLVDKLQSKEGAQAALQDIEKFLEEAPSMLSSGPDVLAAEYEGVITPELQTQIGETFEKHVAVQQMIQNRQACLRKLADKQVRPVQLVAPRPENPPRSKSPFSPKHGDGLKFTFDLPLPGKRVSRKSPNPRKVRTETILVNIRVTFSCQRVWQHDLFCNCKRNSRFRQFWCVQIEVIHDYQESRSCVSYGLEGEDSPDLLKRHVMKELFDTERIYVEELLSVLLVRAEIKQILLYIKQIYSYSVDINDSFPSLKGYRAEMENPALSSLLPPILHSKQDILFGNMPEIYNFHSRIFLQDLEGCLETPESVGACFLERVRQRKLFVNSQTFCLFACLFFFYFVLFKKVPFYTYSPPFESPQKESFQMYECYCQNKPRSDALWRQFSDCHFFQECQKNLEHKLGLDSYLLKPVQRLTKYQLLLKELLKYSTDCKGTSELQGALTAMLDLLKSVNDSMHQIAITGYEGDICELGRVLMQGSFSVWISHKRGPTRMKELARFKPMQRHLFLYERALLFCKRREEHGDGGDKTPSYSFKHCLKMTAVGITENVKGDQKKFEIWYSGREEVYVVQGRAAIQRGTQGLPATAGLSPAVNQRLSLPAFPNKQQRVSVSSEDTESGRSSPDPQAQSPKKHQQNRRSWPGPHHSADLCEGLEDSSGGQDVFHPSDIEEEVLVQLNKPDSVAIHPGDVIQLKSEDAEGRWLVKNLSVRQEGFIPAARLPPIRRHSSWVRPIRHGGKKKRKF